MTGLPSASSATLVAGELNVRFVEHSVDGAERLGVTAYQLFSAFGGVCGPTSTLPLEGRLTEACFGLPNHALLSAAWNRFFKQQYWVRWLRDDVSVRNDAAPVMVQLAGFSCSLSGETLIAEPSSDYSSVDAARAALEPA